ncbi:hypothetical protein K4L06_20560 [Lysobacter sp. BMK333-48F3]|uniref:hypothetical protein n=1 Tax=Lysobacter sp. BMK333-48F3 TaxID=2867962 RepID=UPI001C8C2B9D|nr:hypothetical protein [Lysobacter sp. BMK333-48F3]MBX9403706.1 hypothetical protein [Lysobacter sp. BMK333-48F3]
MRVIDKAPVARGGKLRWVAAAVAVALAVAGWWSMREPASGATDAVPQADAPGDAANGAGDDRLASAPRAPRDATQGRQAMPDPDPDDLAAYFQAGDPEPTGAQVIEALQQAGVRTGLGAFNPPGTSPPLVGLAVPEDFALPPGYVRHHQVTDEGVAIEPILMFSPDFVLHDAQGRPIAMPADRVVPPALAPPGLPLRQIQIPPR